ncbi:MAG: TonB-dependent receptor [Acidobacteria bacterium]|nr:TonB-dependent receptor [Acidobacteriota bacterium]
MLRGVLRVAVVAFVAVLSAVPAFGQGAVAEINGNAVDQTGAALPGATITITDEATGLRRTGVANESGRFVIPAVTPGRYTIRAELSGFQTQTRTGITILVGQAVTLNFTLPIGTLTDVVTVTGEAPIVEVTQTQIGANISAQQIEDLPTQGRQQYALLQLVPGLTPNLGPGAFEGAQYSANGRQTGGNLFLVDGMYNNDDRTLTGSGSQTRMTIDTTAEYQVLTHEYGAEYGGATGVIVNAVTKSGTNDFHGRGAYYLQDSSLDATNYFLKKEGRENPDSGVKTALGSVGGPILRNKAFFFINLERLRINEAANLNFPPEAAPLATSYSVALPIKSTNLFHRLDYQLNGSHSFSWRALFDPNAVDGQSHVRDKRTISAMRIERAPKPGEFFFSGQWLGVLGARMVNEARLSRVTEELHVGDQALFDTGGDKVFELAAKGRGELSGLGSRDQLDFGSGQLHPDYQAGPHESPSGASVTTIAFSDQLTYTPGNHTLKFGFGASQNGGTNVVGGNYFGLFEFQGNRPFDPAQAPTYPSRFRMRLGELFYEMDDWRTNVFVADKWQATGKLTLNLGIRYDYQHLIPQTKDAFAPRAGIAYAPDEKTVIRAGIGRFYEYQATAVASNLLLNAVISPTNQFDTGEDISATRGVLPAHPCLRPDGREGLAVISAACRAQLVDIRNRVAAGGFINTEPRLDGNRQMGYLIGFSAGVQRELLPGVALTVDYVGNRGRDQTLLIDINEPRLLPDGRIGRPGASVFDPDGRLIPAAARNTSFQRVLQYQTRPEFNTDYDALEVSVVRRLANRWSGRMAYTLSRSRDVDATTTGGGNIVEKRVNNDLDPRLDYGLANTDNRHAFSSGANWDAWRGLAAGFTVRYYSGNPVNETLGRDVNGDRDGANFDRPVRGRDDATRPIVSKVDANGVAVRNGIKGNNKVLLDLRLQYVYRMAGQQTMGFYWEIYNALDRVNFGNPIGDRRSPFFMQSITADLPRTMQLGWRYTF